MYCVYTDISSLAPSLWDGKRFVYEPGSRSDKLLEVDLMIHIGPHRSYDGYGSRYGERAAGDIIGR